MALEVRELWFKYEKYRPDVVKGLSLTVQKGEFLALLGGNGAGKTTSLQLLAGLLKPYRGKVSIEGSVGVLPQDPKTLFVKKTVREDLLEMLEGSPLTDTQRKSRLDSVARLCRLDGLLDRHPYDLSGGEQQRAALAKVLLTEPKLLLLDEPTKGLDSFFKLKFAKILKELSMRGITVVMVSHDVEFCAEHASLVSMFFDGQLVTTDTPHRFFGQNSFYTTAANRMSRCVFRDAVTAGDVADLYRTNMEGGA